MLVACLNSIVDTDHTTLHVTRVQGLKPSLALVSRPVQHCQGTSRGVQPEMNISNAIVSESLITQLLFLAEQHTKHRAMPKTVILHKTNSLEPQAYDTPVEENELAL